MVAFTRERRELILNYFRAQSLLLQRRRLRPEQQGKSNYEKIPRVPNLPLPRTRALGKLFEPPPTAKFSDEPFFH